MIEGWKELSSLKQIEDIKKSSSDNPVIIYKHSTRCAISSVALDRLERQWDLKGIEFYYLDLIRYRNVSNAIEKVFGVYHQSPQVLLIKNGHSIYDVSHMAINYTELVARLEKEVV